jgi:Cu/Ag efflux pump CusA
VTPQDIAATAIESRNGVAVTVGQVAQVLEGPQTKRGDASADGHPAVILSVQKQPGANTLSLTQAVDKAIAEVRGSLPADVVVNEHQFRQAEFIESSVHNVFEALRDAGILVTVVLFLFLLNFRTTIITVTAIPLSFWSPR